MHIEHPHYGSHGSRHADFIAALMIEYECANALDYGAGKGRLANALAGIDVRNYDPAIPEFAERPQPADLVISTDVLEHIEPEYLENVLIDLSQLAKKVLFIVIACRPASHTLPDGSNTHKIIETPKWWKIKLSKRFEIIKWYDKPGECACVARPLVELGHIKSTVAVADVERNQQVVVNCARIIPRLKVDASHGRDGDNGRRAVLVCFGPSLKATWLSAAAVQLDGADLFTVSAAHRFMIDHGIIPFAHIDCDPREHKQIQIGDPHPDVKYWLASCVHPSWFDKLKDHNVALWHAHNGKASLECLQSLASERNQRIIIGGGSVGIRALSLLYAVGYRDIEVHGMDCSYENGEVYAGAHLGKEKPGIRVQCRGRWFDTSPVFVLYARYFRKQLELLKDCQLRFHGNGLLQTMYRLDVN